MATEIFTIGSIHSRRFDRPGVRVDIDELFCFAAKMDSDATAIDFVHGIRSLQSRRGFRSAEISAEVDGSKVKFGRREVTDLVRFAKWFQRHIEESDKISVSAGWGSLVWQSPQSRERSEAEAPMSGRLNSAAITIGGRSLDRDQFQEFQNLFKVIAADEHTDAAEAFLLEADVSEGPMIPSYGSLTIVG